MDERVDGCCPARPVAAPAESRPARSCPRCGAPGQPVKNVTVRSMVRGRVGKVEDRDYYLCPTPTCEVVYFAPATGQVFAKGDLRVRVWFQGDRRAAPHLLLLQPDQTADRASRPDGAQDHRRRAPGHRGAHHRPMLDGKPDGPLLPQGLPADHRRNGGRPGSLQGSIEASYCQSSRGRIFPTKRELGLSVAADSRGNGESL